MPPSPAERKGPRDDRFLLVVPWELNHPGGVNQVVRNLYDGMARRPGLRPWVAVKSWGHPRPRAGRTEGRRTLRLRLREPFPGTGGIKARLLFWLTLPAVLVRLHRWLRRHRVTVVNAHYPGLWLLPVALLRGSGLWQGRLILSLHGQDLRDARQWRGVRGRLWQWLGRRADRIGACSEALAAEARAALPAVAERIQALPNGVAPDRIRATAARPATLAGARAPAAGYLACVATFEAKKGQDVLIRAFQALAADYPGLDLVLAGRRAGAWDGLRSLVRELGLADRVHFLPNLDHDQALGVIRDARVFVLPSRYEPFGIVLLEAGVFAVPVVASRVGGIPQIVRADRDGLLVPPEEPAALAASLRALLADPGRARQLGESLQRRVLAEFTWSRAVERYLRVAGVAPPTGSAAMAEATGWRGP